MQKLNIKDKQMEGPHLRLAIELLINKLGDHYKHCDKNGNTLLGDIFDDLQEDAIYIQDQLNKQDDSIRETLSSIREISMGLLCDETSMSSDGKTDYSESLLNLSDQIESTLTYTKKDK